MMNQATVGEVLGDLAAEGLLDKENETQASDALARSGGNPWYLRAMVGFGAWWAAMFFMGFFSLLTHSKPAALFFGIVLIVGAILVRRTQGGDFLNQLALAASLSGQLLVLFGSDLSSATSLALLVLLMQAVLIAFYADQTHRLLSTLVAVGAIEVLLFDWKWTYGTALLAGLLGLVSIYLWLKETVFVSAGMERLVRPVAYGLVIALFGLLLPSIFPPFLDAHNPLTLHVRYLWLSTALLGAGLLYLVHVLLTERGLAPFGSFALTAYGAVVLLTLPAQRAPGLIGALLVLLLGFRRGNRLLMGMALLFLAVFLSAYYYHLSISLLMKSAALAGSGVVLLALRWLLLQQWPAQEVDHAH
ncbi:MAG: DUF4401 domain-containing protein [Burkholderiales bacterium]|nr:DUF4401 domain-containing protein [Burkholderiales bacterium]